MQRLKGRSIVLVALAALACSGDPIGNEGTPTEIVANPDVVFVTQGDSQAVLVSVIDEDGQVLEADPAATNVGSGIAVVRDPTFQEVTTDKPISRQARFYVKGVDLTATSFDLTAFGLTKTIEVTSVPGQLNATISDTVPALGSPVTITLPPGVFATDSSAVTVNGVVQTILSSDPAAGTITFLPAPNSLGPVVLSNVGVTSNPNIVFTLATPDQIRTDSVTALPSTLSTTTPNGGQSVTLTITDPRFTLDPASTQVVIGADTAATVALTPTSVTFAPIAGGVGPANVVNVIVGGYPLVLNSTADTVHVAATTQSLAGTGSPATAPTIDLVTGSARGVVDAVSVPDGGCAVGVPCQYYKVVMPTDGSFTTSATWEGTSDVGVYFFESDGATPVGGTECDAHDDGTAAPPAKPETCSQTVTAGTYILAVAPFGPFYDPAVPNPAWVKVDVTLDPPATE